MKQCTMCKLTKELLEFSKDSSRKDGLQAKCKACQKTLSAKHYVSNKDDYTARRDARVLALKLEIRQMKESNPCVDCGHYYPSYVMQYDHTSDDKVKSISGLLWEKCSRSKVLAEIAKCDLVCSNCHAERTFDRLRKAGKVAEHNLMPYGVIGSMTVSGTVGLVSSTGGAADK